MSTKIDTLWKTYSATSDLIQLADTKATAILAINGVIASLYFRNTEIIQGVLTQKPLTIWLFGFSLIFTLISLAFSVYCVIPRLNPIKSHGLIFFGDIEKTYLSGDAYEKAIKETTNEEIEACVAHQIWTISKIASKKYRAVTSSIVFFALAIITSTAFMFAAI